jgi:MYXO-CTERM domain-containing protein
MAPGSTFTNHPGVVDFKGHSYFFYHNSSLPGGNNYKRSVCVEEFTYGADGSIPKLTMSTKGPSGIAALDPFQQVEAETIAFSSGLKTQTCSDTGGGMNVTSISNGDYIKVKDVDFLDGVTSFDARVSSATSGAKIELHLDSQSGTLLGTCDVSSASSSSWTTKTCTVSGGSGKHDLFLKFVGGSGDLFKFNWWRFSGPTMPPDGGVGAGGAGGSTGPGTGGVGGGAGASPGKGGSGGGAGTTAGSGGSPGAGGTNAGRGGSTTAGSGGAPGAGGTTPGTGGSPGAGGTNAGRGGSPGAGGTTPGTGGSAVSSGGAGSGGSAGPGGHAGNTAAAGSGGNGTSGADPGGCGCQTGGGAGNGGLAAALCLFASVLGRRRRRR